VPNQIIANSQDRKQSEFEEKLKFKNQFRALDEDEAYYLDSVLVDKREEEKARQKLIDEEMIQFRERQNAAKAALPIASTSATLLPAETLSTSSATLEPNVLAAVTQSKLASVEKKTALTPKVTVKSKQKSLLAGAIKRKLPPADDKQTVKKLKPEETRSQPVEPISTSDSQPSNDVQTSKDDGS